MSRDHRKLRVFGQADQLVTEIYRTSQGFPAAERFGIQAQLRRAAVSVVTNIVEGSARRGASEYGNFLNIAAGSAAEARYLVELSSRLGYLPAADGERLDVLFAGLSAGLENLIRAVSLLKPRAAGGSRPSQETVSPEP